MPKSLDKLRQKGLIMELICKKCKEKVDHLNVCRCDNCWICDDCGTRENLLYYCEGVLCSACHQARVNKRIENFDGDTEYTINIICPRCGYEVNDSWEIKDDSGDYECDDCGNEFSYERIVTVEYTTHQ